MLLRAGNASARQTLGVKEYNAGNVKRVVKRNGDFSRGWIQRILEGDSTTTTLCVYGHSTKDDFEKKLCVLTKKLAMR